MEGETKGRKELKSVIEAINSSDDLESRISLISQIGDTYLIDTSDLAHLIDWLIKILWHFDYLDNTRTCWEDSTCFGIFQCMLNKTILDVAAKYLESDMSNCLSQFLLLGTKASMWGRKHLQDSRDENTSNLFSQLLLGTLNLATTTITNLARSSILGDKVLMLIVENFIFELLNLTKDLIFELKSHLIASELLKASQVVLDAAIKLCRAYSQNSKWDSLVMNGYSNDGSLVDGDVHIASHIVSITGCIIEILYELGIFAAAGGGNLVAVLNVSWKGIVSLLHLGKGILAEKVNVGDIILTLVSLATESLRCAGEAWSSTINQTLAPSEAKRTFLPIKFYLINAVRISLDYPCKAVNLYREISRCVLLITSLGIFLSKETHLRAASEVLVEFLEPTSFHLLYALLNSADLNFESRFLILEWLFTNEMDSSSKNLKKDVNYSTKFSSFDGIFCLNCNSMPKSGVLLLGRVLLFMNLLKSSADLKDEMVLAISKKLDYLLDALVHGDIYSTTLGRQIPILSPGSVPGVTWEPLFSCIVQSLKTFMVVASSNELVWFEVETFLFQNIIHSHFLCVEIVTELWSFVMRHAEKEMINQILESLCLLFKTIASLEPALTPHSSLRKIARSICNLLTWSPTMVVDQVYTSISSDEKSSCLMIVALLMEGFTFGSLSDNVKKVVIQKIVAAFYDFIGSNYKELVLYGSSGSCTNDLIGLPVQAISSALHTSNMKSSDIVDEKLGSQVLKFALSLVHGYRNARDGTKESYAMLLGAALHIISTTEHLYASNRVAELILEFQTLFATVSSDADTALCRFKPSLASFLASLGHMEIPDGEGSVLCPAVCSLYHVLLRERHWAFIHLAISAFGNFAARTTCSQLWRFVPDDAALSFDTSSGKEADEDRFMSELKAFLDKSIALKDAYLCEEQLSHLLKEGLVLNELCKLPTVVSDVSATEVGESVDDECVKKKKRKLDGVCEGIEMLQSGLKAMSNALAEADAEELKEAFSPYISSLEDVISHLVSLSG